MRKIEESMASAINQRKSWKSGNTEVLAAGEAVRVLLHGNLIAVVRSDGLTINMCGWPTATTRNRLSAVMTALGVPFAVVQSNHVQCLYNRRNGALSAIPVRGDVEVLP